MHIICHFAVKKEIWTHLMTSQLINTYFPGGLECTKIPDECAEKRVLIGGMAKMKHHK